MSAGPAAAGRSAREAMRDADGEPPVYVVYPAALFHGWEVIREHERDVEPEFFDLREQATAYAETQAATMGGGLVRLENWFGDTEGIWEVPSRAARCIVLGRS